MPATVGRRRCRSRTNRAAGNTARVLSQRESRTAYRWRVSARPASARCCRSCGHLGAVPGTRSVFALDASGGRTRRSLAEFSSSEQQPWRRCGTLPSPFVGNPAARPRRVRARRGAGEPCAARGASRRLRPRRARPRRRGRARSRGPSLPHGHPEGGDEESPRFRPKGSPARPIGTRTAAGCVAASYPANPLAGHGRRARHLGVRVWT